MQDQTPPQIAIIPTPGLGHLIPLTELARRFTEFKFNVTILTLNDGSPPSTSQLALFQNLLPSVSHLTLPPVRVTDLHSSVPIETRMTLTLTRSIPFIRDSLRVLSESTRLVAFVVDHMGSQLLELAQEFGILSYVFFLTSALGLCCAHSFPKLDKLHTCEYSDLPEPVQFCPSSVPVHGADFPDPVQDRKHEVYKFFLSLIERYSQATGILVNSFFDLEPVAFKYLMENCCQEDINNPPVYPIGPVIRTGSKGGLLDGSDSLKWLDEQPNNSVLFVSFGSGGNLSLDQLTELALGLELSGQRFLWIVKPPNITSNASFFSINKDDMSDNPLEYLPQGFLDRTKGFGLVVPDWAPQVQILSQGSIGGFLTHCGWNSIMEGIVHGVPLIAWPLYAEQRMNFVLVVDEFKVALRVKPNEKGLVQREQIAHFAQCSIQGEQGKILRERMRVLKDAANAALNVNGSSKQSLTEVVQAILNHKIDKMLL